MSIVFVNLLHSELLLAKQITPPIRIYHNFLSKTHTKNICLIFAAGMAYMGVVKCNLRICLQYHKLPVLWSSFSFLNFLTVAGKESEGEETGAGTEGRGGGECEEVSHC